MRNVYVLLNQDSMCGILAIQGKHRYKEIPEALIERGRDSQGMYQDEYAQLIQTRLHITGGDVQLPYQQEEFVLLFNGEIYNYKTFADNEYKAIIEAYKSDRMNELDGQYAIIIYNKETHLMDVYLDELRIHALYMDEYNGSTIYSSNLRSLPKLEYDKYQHRGYGNITKQRVL